ncbi:putative methyltransferase [Streptomyces aurantiacus JA 4570]|uniref:Putative methyltransferase n=1 Tax=Streptomyces aurantiacus JA 4570 TaxID=1286094 RepID=S3ZTJ1_9ACTN|nr:KedN5 family methylcobalamin-dependent radical SAM C-methyltransferase [Streptomyces aurantiacus]EPH46079.1 putative methyltransferase [Streptomyces aurantiacus JA 4570]
MTKAPSEPAPLRVEIVQQGFWNLPLESMPLAAGYLKATVLEDPCLAGKVAVDIRNFSGTLTHEMMADTLFGAEDATIPDVLAFSVLGWNFRAFGALAETFKQLNPAGWVVFGGTHVTGQAERVFHLFPHVDVVVNGEGELTFRDLVRTLVEGASRPRLGHVAGLSWKEADGTVRTNQDRERITDLEVIPSPFLTGAIDLLDADGRFRYDVALIETNRGCPYKCSFCYWGGAVGQRVRSFSRERLRQELTLFAKLGVRTVATCDANFGMFPADLELTEDLVEIKRTHGYPHAFESSWAKNKSHVFFEIVRKLKDVGLTSSFTLALQSLEPEALTTMGRRNMKVNEWHDLARRLAEDGLECCAELIWGAPGETVESFLRGYDELAGHVSRVAVYPMLLLPNTEYAEHRSRHGIVSVRGEHDDFEYVLAHRSMTFAENRHMRRFVFWAKVMAECGVLRHSWSALRELAGWSQSRVLREFADWIDTVPAPEAVALAEGPRPRAPRRTRGRAARRSPCCSPTRPARTCSPGGGPKPSTPCCRRACGPSSARCSVSTCSPVRRAGRPCCRWCPSAGRTSTCGRR